MNDDCMWKCNSSYFKTGKSGSVDYSLYKVSTVSSLNVLLTSCYPVQFSSNCSALFSAVLFSAAGGNKNFTLGQLSRTRLLL